MNHKRLYTMFSLFIIAAFLLSACRLSDLLTRSTPEVTEPPAVDTPNVKTEEPSSEIPEVPEISGEDLYAAPFAEYKMRSDAMPARYGGGYTLPLRSDQVNGLEKFEFSSAQLEALLNNGFVVTPPDYDPSRMYQEFYQAYESIRYDDTPVFITTDAVFHVYHLIFDKMLRDLERTSFMDLLNELTTAMLDESLQQYQKLIGTEMETAATRNVAYFTVPAMILGLSGNVPDKALELASLEVELIEGGGGFNTSPIWDTGGQGSDDLLLEDYSQYIPRGHYTRDEALKTYFKAMMWYGRMTFRLKDPIETQRALLTVQAMRNAKTSSGRSALELWQNIYDPTVFIVGKADDRTVGTADILGGPHHDGLHHAALLHATARNGFLDRHHDDVADGSITAVRTAKNLDALNPASAGVVSHIQIRLHLDHLVVSRPAGTRPAVSLETEGVTRLRRPPPSSVSFSKSARILQCARCRRP